MLDINNTTILRHIDINESYTNSNYLNKSNEDEFLNDFLYDTSEYKFYTISKFINVYAITVITLLGLLGNLLSIYIFCSQQYKRMPLQIYLLSLSISDIIVLVTHYIDFTFRAWINVHGLYDSSLNFVDKSWIFCKLVSYLRNVFRTTSAYIMLLMTWERFIALYFPMKKTKLCSFRINRILIKILMSASFLFNSTQIYLSDIVKDPISNQYICEIKETLKTVYFYTNVSFVLFTILIPIIIIGTFTYILLYKITEYISIISLCCKYDRNNLNYINHKPSDSTNILTTNFNNLDVQTKSSSPTVYYDCQQQRQRLLSIQNQTQQNNSNNNNNNNNKPSYSLRTTYMLIILSKWFIILHVPYFICWLIIHIDEFNNQFRNKIVINSTNVELSFNTFSVDFENNLKYEARKCIIRAFHNIAEVIYITNYAINFLLYTINGKLFRQRYKQILVNQFNKCFMLFRKKRYVNGNSQRFRN